MFETMELADRCRKVAGTEVGFASDAELCAAAVELEAGLAALQAAQLHVLAELDAREVCDRQFGLPTASWLADRTHLPRAVASGRVRVATKLRRRLGRVDEALSDARITFDHARLLADAANPRVADRVADHQDQFIEHAQHVPFAIWRRTVAEHSELWDQDGGYDPARDRARNRLHLDPVGDTVAVSGELVGETAMVVGQAIEHAADQLFHRYHRDHELTPDCEMPSRATLRAEALADLCRRAQDTEPGQSPTTDITLVAHLHEPDPIEPVEPPGPIDTKPPTSGDLITILRTPDGARLDPARYAHLLCDPVLHPLLVDQRQVPLALGLAVRLATPGQRRALAVRDGGCVFPGCDRPPGWCDAHHVIPSEQLGPTDLVNLAPLCRYHHGITHRRGWAMEPDPEGGFRWTTPSGLVLLSRLADPTIPPAPDG
jgi:Domain of unknown function (DUF222)